MNSPPSLQEASSQPPVSPAAVSAPPTPQMYIVIPVSDQFLINSRSPPSFVPPPRSSSGQLQHNRLFLASMDQIQPNTFTVISSSPVTIQSEIDNVINRLMKPPSGPSAHGDMPAATQNIAAQATEALPSEHAHTSKRKDSDSQSQSSDSISDISVDDQVHHNTKAVKFIQLKWGCPYQPECSYQSDAKDTLNEHIISAHNRAHFRCLIRGCTASFNRSYAHCIHQEVVHHDTTNFECSNCTRVFPNYIKLRSHNYLIHRIGLFQCRYDNCSVRCNNISKMVAHYRTHKRVICPECSREINNAYFERHQKLHNGERSFACNICKKTFNLKHYLKRHLNVHQNAPIKCTYCSKMFSKKWILDRHILEVHQEEEEIKEESESLGHLDRLKKKKGLQCAKVEKKEM